MSGYGLQLRKKPVATRPTLPPPAPGFGAGDEDDDDVEKDIARQAAMKRSKKEFKQETVRPLAQDKTERKPKYILKLMEKAKEREREHEIVYEKKLLKERSKDDHLFSDKEKFVTSGYKKKLAEQAKWLEEERLRELREAKNDVTKGDLTDFYFNLNKNVAFGAGGSEPKKPSVTPEPAPDRPAERQVKEYSQPLASPSRASTPDNRRRSRPAAAEEAEEAGAAKEQPPVERYKRTEDAVAAARDRYLARKRARARSSSEAALYYIYTLPSWTTTRPLRWSFITFFSALPTALCPPPGFSVRL
ncbi:unnamed protein product [Spirodela intermedia]|uniref:Nuclear speckle splicing regulatory protein 1 N-terminal domain-containing protein n=1 Tax=Spirodela intermedia TaxID=51605 RepID=A0A7I8IS84_SPIIN|nr:unnamed protein product [Spirodela intermedia]CAA6660615.1 unnamed protein product [Spirodela intermedia]